MDEGSGIDTRINSFALVSYLSGPLAEFVDKIRHDFAPESMSKAHVTILPPRPLRESPPAAMDAWVELRNRLQDVPPFRLELGEIEVFPSTRILYLSIKAGFWELDSMHQALNAGRVAFQESYPYYPHVTLVHELAPEDLPYAVQFARWRWSEFEHPRSISVERLTFVQNTLENYWIDLAMLDLRSP